MRLLVLSIVCGFASSTLAMESSGPLSQETTIEDGRAFIRSVMLQDKSSPKDSVLRGILAAKSSEEIYDFLSLVVTREDELRSQYERLVSLLRGHDITIDTRTGLLVLREFLDERASDFQAILKLVEFLQVSAENIQIIAINCPMETAAPALEVITQGRTFNEFAEKLASVTHEQMYSLIIGKDLQLLIAQTQPVAPVTPPVRSQCCHIL